MDWNGLRKVALSIGVVVGALAVPAAASAATVGTDGTTIEYTAATGEANQTAIAASGTDIVFTDAGAGSLTDADGAGGCDVSGGVATCHLEAFTATHVSVADGDDTVSAVGNLAPLTQLTIDAGPGNDTVGGGNGADVVLGGIGNDRLDGNQGLDTVLAGRGNDVFVWDPGDFNDTLEGQENRDTLEFNGSNINENIELSANGDRLRLTRDVAAVTIDADGVEAVALRSFGGADTTTVNDLGATDVTEFTDDLAAVGGGGDGSADQVIVNGTDGIDSIGIAGSPTAGVDVTGLASTVALRGQEPALDRLTVHTLAGRDAFDTDALEPGSIQFTID